MGLIKKLFLLSIKTALGIFAILPVVWLVSAAFKLPEELYAVPPVILPSSFNLDNFRGALTTVPFGKYFVNTIVFVLFSVSINTVVAVFAGYALSVRNRLAGIFFALVLVALAVPKEILLIPVYSNVLKLGWGDTLAGLVLPFAVDALSVFLMRQAFLTVPKELEEAARIDGAGLFNILFNVYLPAVKPFLFTTVLFSFIGFWGDFLWPLVVLKSPDNYTLQVGLNMMLGTFINNFRFVAAGSVLTLIPVIVVFIFFQRGFMQGFMQGSGK